jgi:hypothetical protein
MMSAAARLETPDESVAAEVGWTEDLSIHGARVITKRRWRAHDRVVVTILTGCFRPAPAEVVYCQSLVDARCAIGVKFDKAIVDPVAGVT